MPTTAGEADSPGSPEGQAASGIWLTDLSLVFMALIWGVNFSVVKYGTDVLSPLAFNGIRLSVAAVALTLIVALSRARWPSRRDALALLALGVLGNGVYQWLFIEGIARTRAGDAALVIAAAPAFIALIGRISGVERVNRRGVAGIALSILGIALVVFGSGQVNGGSARIIGDLLVLAGSLCWSVYTVILKPYTHRVAGLQLSALTMIGGAVPLAIIATPSILSADWTHLPALGWGSLAYSSLGALVLAYLFWYRGVRIIGPTRTSMYGNLQPVIALFVAWLTLSEVPTSWQLVGGALVMGGLILTRL